MTIENKQNPNHKYFFWLFLTLLFVLFGLEPLVHKIESYQYNKSNCTEPRRRTWQRFGIDIPKNYNIYGIDVSHYQCAIDWEKVKLMNDNGVRVRFAFFRATRGTSFLDFRFKENWEGAKSVGILRGAYHFYYFRENPIEQARFFCENVKVEKGDLPPVLDVENDKMTDDAKLPKEAVINSFKAWLQYVEKETGVRPIIYTNLDYYKKYIAYNFSEYTIWIAAYKVSNVGILPDGKRWWFWQVTDKARCNGISEPIDFNVFSGNTDELRLLLKP